MNQKAWNKRQDCWADIVKHYEDYGLKSIMHAFAEEMQSIPEANRVRNLRAPVYGYGEVIKEVRYIKLGAMYIAKYNFPKELVYCIDETTALFVTRATRQRVKKGTRKLSVIGKLLSTQ